MMTYTVKTRRGWGWVVTWGDGKEGCPIESAMAAQRVADALNAGRTSQEAYAGAGLVFDHGRWYMAD